jgi:hypothetical protein
MPIFPIEKDFTGFQLHSVCFNRCDLSLPPLILIGDSTKNPDEKIVIPEVPPVIPDKRAGSERDPGSSVFHF